MLRCYQKVIIIIYISENRFGVDQKKAHWLQLRARRHLCFFLLYSKAQFNKIILEQCVYKYDRNHEQTDLEMRYGLCLCLCIKRRWVWFLAHISFNYILPYKVHIIIFNYVYVLLQVKIYKKNVLLANYGNSEK